jgi:hypothetical protein
MHLDAVVLPQMMRVGTKTVRLSAAIAIPVIAKPAKTHAMVEKRKQTVVAVYPNLNASRMLVKIGAKKILVAKKIMIAQEHV